jgi:hypothetical protein
MDFIDKDGVLHIGFDEVKAEKFGWKPVGDKTDKVKIKEEVTIKSEEE